MSFKIIFNRSRIRKAKEKIAKQLAKNPRNKKLRRKLKQSLK